MPVNLRICAIPSALLFLLCRTALGYQDEHRDVQSSTSHRRDLDAVPLLDVQQPRGVRKMSDNPGEKFWPHYWDFGDTATYSNTSSPENPLALHETPSTSLFGRALFGRDGACPTTPYNTSSCASIGYPNSCCPVNTYCYGVTDTGNGPIGCCPNGGSCGSTIGNCPSGYTSCPNSANKGCCIPGYACAGSICVNAGTSTAIVSPSTTTTSSSTTTVAISVTTVTLVNISPSPYTTTATVTVTQSATSTSASAVVPVIVTTNASSTTASIAPAAVSSTTTTITTSSGSGSTTTTTSVVGYCPTGYYMCSAVYLGGCCQVDRDCNTTSCPTTASTTVINGSPTVVAPTGASSNAATCASGWFSCPASLGGNCCPSGYNCAQTNCPAIATGAASHDKEAPNTASSLNAARLLLTTIMMTWTIMMFL